MLEKQRQQDPSSNTVRNPQWDWEELECVDTTDAGAAWRDEQMTSTKNSSSVAAFSLAIRGELQLNRNQLSKIKLTFSY